MSTVSPPRPIGSAMPGSTGTGSVPAALQTLAARVTVCARPSSDT